MIVRKLTLAYQRLSTDSQSYIEALDRPHRSRKYFHHGIQVYAITKQIMSGGMFQTDLGRAGENLSPI